MLAIQLKNQIKTSTGKILKEGWKFKVLETVKGKKHIKFLVKHEDNLFFIDEKDCSVFRIDRKEG